MKKAPVTILQSDMDSKIAIADDTTFDPLNDR
jgi:hypothetical protein